MVFNISKKSINQEIKLHKKTGVRLFIKREDQIHEFVSGNKYRKLKYNIMEAGRQGFKTILSFGGAYSNHIAAVAAAGQLFGLKTIGVIRGDELEAKIQNNPTLQFAQHCGMQFKFVSRSDYRLKSTPEFINSLHTEFGNSYIVPEGGTNHLAVKGCKEILNDDDFDFDYVCCAVGTGGTISGLINCSKPGQQVLGFPALKGDFLQQDISKFANKTNWKLVTDYHFGGYAKINTALVKFINNFKKEQDIPLDPVYTGKMMYGVFNLIAQGYFPKGSKILTIHTGGLQGILGMNMVLKKKNLPIIE
ncbi:MAG: 1-aminocyclopropane-1-carboxylate deaminase/D-cysteine desulfhydrase [Aestuariibaculum sp.]